MIFPLLVLLLAPATRVGLVDEVYDIPPAEWRYVDLSLKQQPVTVACHFEAQPGNSVRLALLRGEDLQRMRHDDVHGMVDVTPAGPRGHLHYTVHEPGDYYVVVDNRQGSTAAQVRLRIWLDFAPVAGPAAGTLSPRRRAVVVTVSLAVFFGIVLFAGRKLLAGLRK